MNALKALGTLVVRNSVVGDLGQRIANNVPFSLHRLRLYPLHSQLFALPSCNSRRTHEHQTDPRLTVTGQQHDANCCISWNGYALF